MYKNNKSKGGLKSFQETFKEILKSYQETFKKKKLNIAFSDILTRILSDKDVNLTELHKELLNLGLDITYSSLYTYYNGTAVPRYSMAKKLLKLERYSIKDEDLEDVLEISKKIVKEKRDDVRDILPMYLKIRPEEIHKKYRGNPLALKEDLRVRINEEFNEEDKIELTSMNNLKKFSAYVTKLIKKDLESNGFLKEK